MILEFNSPNLSGLLPAIAAATGSVIENGTIKIGEKFGKGYIKAIVVNPQLWMLIRQYELKEELIIKRGPVTDGNNTIILAFHNLYRDIGELYDNTRSLPSVQIATAGVDYEDFFPSNTKVNTLIILIHLNFLRDLLDPVGRNDFFQIILSGTQSFLFEEILSPEMQDVADEIVGEQDPGALTDFYYRLKAEELIYLFFKTLTRRDDLSEYLPNKEDVKRIYAIRDKIIADLSINPNLADLAKQYGMSESKIKRLFKQIFGDTLYNYYQSIRMKQAAFLIRDQRLSIAQAGYQMGFTNLSHFARVFERYHGIKPKKYAKIY
ncbi:helix-turn-helix transcriptional regulator [Mucilaginibacter flavus]|uniref:helix-turn-helix transcriptional regulator n=1 Tax=Mucilaginibacter flavus TaxID=931504 RepID=UPI0025B3F440|nr:AraC family transcriptional regulator [Mucilaginibacter flavus]MDN3584613.1 AraC family transcriptional regulator [Mucilaginibacter flavus]